ncbi:phosphodiester glycosidase family protein [Rufibacter latericius]|uniref:Phosphodiester glycosidase family protein n=1 Tax=Rufibacter latericius TaxID=2487040 RepID=A0A3M9MNN9_9BACT|nr:phosphodiester glycosidase family protein [Rufibacter latericius]RNI26807.1 phosphodiester glycosidase family protein [Rufibacter latericius]
MKKLFVLCFAFISLSGFAQVKWQPSPEHQAGLPASVKVFFTADSLDGKPFRAYYLEADLKDPKLEILTRIGNGKRYTPKQYYEQETGNVLAVVNTTFFSFADNSNLNLVINNGKVLAPQAPVRRKNPNGPDTLTYYPTTGAIGFFRNRTADVAWAYNVGKKKKTMELTAPYAVRANGQPNPAPSRRTARNMKRWKPRVAVGGGPVLVQDGKAHITAEEEMRGGASFIGPNPRTVMGYTPDQKLIILMVEGRNKGVAEGASLEQLARLMVELGCREALNLDGGGSSALYVKGKDTIKPSDKEGQRPVPAVLVLKYKE